MTQFTRLCVFCGSSMGSDLQYRAITQEVGVDLARRGITLVYGGGNIGLMGILADAVLQAGGQVIGVIPQALVEKEVGHKGLSQLHVVESMHARKALMAEQADAFVALPGGMGTFEEFCEVVTWAQLGLHSKPCGLLNINGYYDHLLAMFDRAASDRLLRPQHRALVRSASTWTELWSQLESYSPAPIEKWIDRDET